MYASHSPIHTHIHTPTAIGCHARHQPARQEQLGVRCLAQGHIDKARVGSNRQLSDCQMTALTSWAISPHIAPYRIVKCAIQIKLNWIESVESTKHQHLPSEECFWFFRHVFGGFSLWILYYEKTSVIIWSQPWLTSLFQLLTSSVFFFLMLFQTFYFGKPVIWPMSLNVLYYIADSWWL